MNVGGRIDAWLLRHGTWFMPSLLGAFAIAMMATLAVDTTPPDEPRLSVLAGKPAPAALRGTPVPPADVAVERSVPVLATAAASRDGQVEVCAVGWVGVDGSGAADLDAVVATPIVQRGRRTLLRTLAASGDELARAAAVALEVAARPAAAGPAPAQLSAAPSSAGPAALAALAASTRDPRVYQLAHRECTSLPRPGAPACSLDATQWALLDEGNGVPWLVVLDEAARRGDEAGRDEALFKLASAQRFDERPHAVAAAVADLAGNDDAAVLAAWTLAADSIAGDAVSTRALPSLLQTCRAASGDANRWQLCHNVAGLLLERSDSLEAFLSGKGLAAIVGRDAGGADSTRDAAAAAGGRPGTGGYECAQLRRELARWQGSAASGQMAMLRQGTLKNR